MSRILLLCTVAILTNTDGFGQPPTRTPIVAQPVTPTKPPSLRELAQRKRASAERTAPRRPQNGGSHSRTSDR